VGNHTMHHPDMAAISEKSRFEKELKDLEESYKAATGYASRCPYCGGYQNV
jgi:peptidoglycan-N-acetylmuramic acid deacetylase